MTTLMATPTSFCPSSSSIYTSLLSCPKAPNFRPSKSIPAPWTGFRHMGTLVSSRKSLKLVMKGRGRSRGSARASLFGVGAPEALVIGVVALLVFGPKGLAEVARNLGKTLRAFQPTIRELQDVSREFKSTLEREIGLDEISNPPQNMYSSSRTNITPTPSISTEDSQTMVDPNGSPPPKEAYTSEEYLKITEAQLKAVAAQQQGEAPETSYPELSQSEPQSQPQPQPQAIVEEAPPEKPESSN